MKAIILLSFTFFILGVSTLNLNASVNGNSLQQCSFLLAAKTPYHYNPNTGISSLKEKSKCLKGKTDAKNYHHKRTEHIVWGTIFGPFAVIGAAFGNPTPNDRSYTKYSENRDLFKDRTYLKCYRQKARTKNVLNTLIGLLIFPFFWMGIGAMLASR